MLIQRVSLVVAIAVSLAACGDDTRAGGGGSPSDGSGDTTSASSGNTGSSVAASSVAASSVAASSVAASSASTGEPELCPWFGADPGNLVATGSAVGDVIENVSGLIDQCGVARSLWDFAGGYRILSITTGW